MPAPVSVKVALALLLAVTAADSNGHPPLGRPMPSARLPATPDPLMFAVIGDYGWAGADVAQVAELVHTWKPQQIYTVGDNNYPAGSGVTLDANVGQYYHDYIEPYGGAYGSGAAVNAFFPALGNHDWLTSDAQPYFDFFTLPGNERYYTVKSGEVEFVVLDSDSHEPDGIGLSSVQAAWAQNTLQASTATWQVVLLHHAPYSSATHGPNPAVQWPFAGWGADLVIAGHDHTYERLLVDGIPFVVNGTGGAPLYSFPAVLPESVVRDNSGHGAQRCAATKTTLSCDYLVVDATVPGGRLVDSFTLMNAATSEQVYLPFVAGR